MCQLFAHSYLRLDRQQSEELHIVTDNRPTNKYKSMEKFYVEAENELPLFERPAAATGVNAPRPPTGPQ